MNKEEILNQITEWIEYNRDQQYMISKQNKNLSLSDKSINYNLGYYKGKISALQDCKQLIQNMLDKCDLAKELQTLELLSDNRKEIHYQIIGLHYDQELTDTDNNIRPARIY